MVTGAAVGTQRAAHDRLLPLNLDPAPAFPDLDHLVEGSSISQLQDHMTTGRLTSVQLTEFLLARTAADEPERHSLISVDTTAREQAQAADQQRAAGGTGPLLGIPITVKDNIETAGPLPTTGGAEILIDHRPDRDAAIVSSLRAAGAVIIGKANLSELAGAMVATPGFSAVGGMSRNPFGATYSPGGSSSGGAVAVAAGLVVASIGTETSGSLTAPASFNGLVAVKPTYGLLDTSGIIPLIRHQDCPGPLTRTVADAAAVMQVLSGGAVVTQDVDCAGLRIGLLAHDIRKQRSALEDTSDAADLLARIESRLTRTGATAVPVDLATTVKLSHLEGDFLTVVCGGLAFDTVGYLRAAGAPIATLADLQAYNMAEPRRRIPAGQTLLNLAVMRGVSRQTYEKQALEQRRRAASILDATLTAAGSDVLVSVSNVHSDLYATAGYPAVTVPAGLRANGMPTGITLIGRPGTDARLLGVAAALEATA